MKTRKDFVKKAVELAIIKNKAVRDAEILNYSTISKSNNPRFDEARFRNFVNEKVAGKNPSIYKKPKVDNSGMMKTTKMVAMMGKIFSKNLKEENAWQKRMLSAGLKNKGLSFPDDWDILPEKVKKARLKKAMSVI